MSFSLVFWVILIFENALCWCLLVFLWCLGLLFVLSFLSVVSPSGVWLFWLVFLAIFDWAFEVVRVFVELLIADKHVESSGFKEKHNNLTTEPSHPINSFR